jgi:hypothetical protein
MQVSLRWLRRYADIPASPERIAAYLTSLGLEVEGVDTVGGTILSLDRIVVGHVLTCEQHPDADRLRVTTVDVGAEARCISFAARPMSPLVKRLSSLQSVASSWIAKARVLLSSKAKYVEPPLKA